MMKLKNMILFMVLCCVAFPLRGQTNWLDGLYQAFPLQGQTWLFGKGNNDRIYATYSAAVPTHLIMVTFPNGASGDFVFRTANLMGLNFKSTGHLINEVLTQFDNQNNVLYVSYNDWKKSVMADAAKFLSLAKRGIPDTVWTCDSSFDANYGVSTVRIIDYKMIYSKNDGQYEASMDTISWAGNNRQEPNYIWHKDKPTAWRISQFNDYQKMKFPNRVNLNDITSTDTGVLSNQVRFYKNTSLNTSYSSFVDYCDSLTKECYEDVSSECKTFKTRGQNFWQLHLFPKVKWFPRTYQNGQPILKDTLAMDFNVAMERRRHSLEHMDTYDSNVVVIFGADTQKIQLHNYRNPYFSDSASVVISVQFVDTTTTVPSRQSYYETSIIDTGNNGGLFSDFYLDRTPKRIVKVENNDIEGALLRLYVESDKADTLALNMRTRCGLNWKNADVDIGEKYRFPSSNPLYPDGFGGTANELIMDTNYIEKRYIYNNCPCLPIPELNNFTASDFRTFIYRSPPMCDAGKASNALYILKKVYDLQIFHGNESDYQMLLRRIVQIGNFLEKHFGQSGFRSKLQRRFPATWYKKLIDAGAFCPDTWENNFDVYEDEYSAELKGFVEKIKYLLKG